MIIHRIANEPLEIEVDSLICVNLDKLDLHRAMLNDCDLQDSSLKYTNLRGADLSSANLLGADLTGAYLMVASLDHANLKNTILKNAKLNGATLISADLSGADLTGSDVWNADFRGANLSDAKINCLRINDAMFEGAVYNKETIWPEGFNYNDIGAVLAVEENGGLTNEIAQKKYVVKIYKRIKGEIRPFKRHFKMKKYGLNYFEILGTDETSKLFKKNKKIQ